MLLTLLLPDAALIAGLCLGLLVLALAALAVRYAPGSLVAGVGSSFAPR